MADKFFIGPMDTGQQNNLKPWAIPDNAYELLRNAYVWRGRVKKRFGATLFKPGYDPIPGAEQIQSRLRVKVGVTAANGNLAIAIADITALFPVKVGAMLSADNGTVSELFTVTATGLPAVLMTTGASTTHTLNTNTGALVLVGSIATANVYYYPALPVMGFTEYELHTINDEQTIAFDTRFAYSVDFAGWYRLVSSGPGHPDAWTGGTTDFFWSTTWHGETTADNILFTTNFTVADGIRYWDGTDWGTAVWTYFVTGGGVPLFIDTARIIVPFDNRLLLLNTIENGVLYQNRMRFSWKGDPNHLNVPLGIYDAFREDDPSVGAGFEDVPVQEAIITVQFLRNRLIVYCERSTWELVSTGSDIRPFIWQQLNTELGAESTFSQIPFDSVVLGVGNVGIHACDGNGVKRVDQTIPDEVFKIHNINDGPKRVCGIRDFFTEMAYWTFPSNDRNANRPYPDRILVLNYLTGSWAFFDDSITTFGYIQNNVNGSDTWETDFGQWIADSSTWQSANLSAKARQVIAGNQEGFTFLVDASEETNCRALQITNIATNSVFTVIDHNLKQGEYIKINDCTGFTTFNNTIHVVASVVDSNTFTLAPIVVAGYTGGGTITRVSKMDIKTKRWNFYGDKGMNTTLSKVDFLVDKTVNGQMTFGYCLSNTLTDNVVVPDALLGTNVLETSPYAAVPAEATQESFWHVMYPQAQGEFVQLHLTMSDAQMTTSEGTPAKFIADNGFELSGIMLLTSPITRF